jgi:trk system potassium uptake protein TrkA
MKQYAILGLGAFGIRMLEELVEITNEIIIIDKNRDIIEKYKDEAKAAYIADAINDAALSKIIPNEIDAVIVDLGGKIEATILATNYLKHLNVKEIIVKAESDEQGEILKMIGATRVVFPDQEAAKHITPILASPLLFSFMKVSPNLSLAEVCVNRECLEKSLQDSNIRQKYGLNVVAIRTKDSDEYFFPNDPSYILMENHVLLVAGTEANIHSFSAEDARKPAKPRHKSFKSYFR